MNSIESRIALMAQMQDAHNREVHPSWRTQGYEYYRAIWVECAELLDHYGWKWWKLQQPDLDQVRLEIVDIWHFGLSELLRHGRLDVDRVDAEITAAVTQGLGATAGDFRTAVEQLAARTLAERDFCLPAFIGVMRALPMEFDELFRHYVGKNVLNRFRQANGYKTGEYRKLWNGVEDNVHLMSLAAELDAESAGYVDALYAALESRYTQSQRN
ncbi:MAG: dUTP diphosphatase [Gammaproteobacteria bacterium]|nr:dUTP diphosphatase [Gammaproteobacteria bacterium]